MFWYKGWPETKFKLLLMLGCMGFYLIVLYLMRTIAAPPGARPAAVFRPNRDDFGDTTLHVVGGRWNQHPTLFSGDEGARRFDLVHTFPACQPTPFAGGQGEYGMVGNGRLAWGLVLRMLACTSGSEGIGVGRGHARVCGSAHCLRLITLFPICVAGHFPR
jgi:hypothetical protein